MIVNYLCIILFIIGSAVSGFALLSLCGFKDYGLRTIYFISIPLGFAVYSLVAGLVYLRFKRPSGEIRIAYLIVFILAAVYLIIRYRNDLKHLKRLIISILAFILLFSMMILPGLYRGEKYYLHKGNVYDKYSYLAETVYVVNYDVTYGETELPEREWTSKIYESGYDMVSTDRPTTALVCASVAEGGSLLFLGYLFVDLTWALLFCSMLVLLEMLFPGKKPVMYVIFSLIYVFCFYCQMQNDIDAWSQESAGAVLLGFTDLWLVTLKKIKDGKGIGIRDIVLLSVFGTSAFMLYPEGTWVYGLVLVIMSVMAVIRWRIWKTTGVSGMLIPATIPIIMICASYLIHPGTVVCAIKQVVGGNLPKIQKWTSFYNYWKGAHELVASSHTGEMIKRALTIIPGWCGMSVLTPIYTGINIIIIMIWLMAMAALSVGIIGLILYYACHVIFDRDIGDGFIRMETIETALISVIVFVIYIIVGKWLTASKILLFLSPFFYVILAMPVMEMIIGNDHIEKNAIIRSVIRYGTVLVSGVFVLTQIACLGLRIYNIISDENGVMSLGYYYPQMENQVKADWTDGFSVKELAGREVAAIAGGDDFSKKDIALLLAYEGVDYYYFDDSTDEPDRYTQTSIRPGDPVVYYSPSDIRIEY